MTPRSFWKLTLKIMGIWLIISSFAVLMQFISTLFAFRNTGGGEFYITGFLLTMTAGIYFLIVRFLIFKPDIIIDKLKLQEGFTEESFSFNMHRSAVLSIAVIIIGGISFIDSLPLFCKTLYAYFQLKNLSANYQDNNNNSWALFYFVKAFIGLLLMIYSREVINLIELKRKQSNILVAEEE